MYRLVPKHFAAGKMSTLVCHIYILSVFCVLATPEVIISPEDMAVKLGDPMLLHCVANGNPLPTITWDTPTYGTCIYKTASITGKLL